MTVEEFKNLKTGDKVIYTPNGEVLTVGETKFDGDEWFKWGGFHASYMNDEVDGFFTTPGLLEFLAEEEEAAVTDIGPAIADPEFGNLERRVRIALDFDGVLHSYTSGWTGEIPMDPPTPGAVVFVEELLRQGYKLHIFTTRVYPDLSKDPKFVDVLHKMEFDDGTHAWEHNGQRGPSLAEEGIRQWLRFHKFPAELCEGTITHKKEHADIMIDDRALRFDGNFGDTLRAIEKNPKGLTWSLPKGDG